MNLTKPLLTLIFILFFGQVFSQKKFDITITLDSSINSEKIKCYYENGTDISLLTDTFVNNTLNLTGDYYSKFVSFRIDYYSKENSLSGNFFIGNIPARIHLAEKNNSKKSHLVFDSILNATLIYDTATNKIWKEFKEYTAKESQTITKFWEKHGNEIGMVDSISLLNQKLNKLRNNRIIKFLKNHPNDYFSFWLFKVQVLNMSLIFMSNDTSYLRSLLVSFNATFPDNFTKSYEGRQVTEKLEGLIKAQEAKQVAFAFSMKDTTGKVINLSDFKGKYILLDFWASWCSPCRFNNPVLKNINDKYQNANFKLISISGDENLDRWEGAIQTDSMNWTNISDLKGWGGNVISEYGIKAFPTYIIVDPAGTIIYRSLNEIEKVQEKMEEILSLGK